MCHEVSHHILEYPFSQKPYHFTVVCLVAWPLHDSEAEVDLGQATKLTTINWSIVQGLNPS